MNVVLIACTILFIMIILKFYGNTMNKSFNYIFSKSFIGIPLRRFSFFSNNIDGIILVILFFTMGITYVIVYNIKIKNVKNDLKIEKHEIKFTGEKGKESLKNETTKKDDFVITDTMKSAFKKILNVDIERQFDLPEYNDICKNKDPSEIRKECELLNNNTCDSANCCMWCNKKNTCIAGKGGVPMFNIDEVCVKNTPETPEMQERKKILSKIAIQQNTNLDKDFEYKPIAELTTADYKVILQLGYNFIKQKKHRDKLTESFKKIPKANSLRDLDRRNAKVFDTFVDYYVKINPNTNFALYKNQGETFFELFSKNRYEKFRNMVTNKELKGIFDSIKTVIDQDINFKEAVLGFKQRRR